MKYIEKFYGKKHLEKQRRVLSEMSNPKGVPLFLVDNSESAKIWQLEFDKYLKLAFCHNIIDKNLRKRLSSNNWEVFFQAHRELMCAYFIENMLNYKISFHPLGSGNSIGEYLLKYSRNETIFIEVKSPIRESLKGGWTGNDSEVIKKNLKRAIKQMPSKNQKNMMILAGSLRLPISSIVSGIIEALYVRQQIVIPIDPSKGPLG